MEEVSVDVGGGPSQTPHSVVSLGRRRGPGVFIVAGLVAVVVLAGVFGAHRSSGRTAAPLTTTVLTTTAPATTVREVSTAVVSTVVATTADASNAAVADRTVTELGGPLLASRTQTELIVHGLGAVVRIDVDRGRVTRTGVPTIGSTAPTFMVAGSRSVLLRPLDNVAGYLVPDDAGPQPLAGRLGNATFWAYPGPKAGLVWLEATDARQGAEVLDLVGFDVDFAPVSVAIRNLWPWGPDFAGQVVVTGVGGAYVTGPSGLTRVTTGDVFAAGPTKWLVRECDESHVCTMATIDRRTDHKEVLDVGSLAADPGSSTGVITQDGRTAAIVRRTGELDVIDLTSGQLQNIATYPSNVNPVAPVWSLDSRFLFFASDTYTVAVFDRTTGTTTALRAEVDHVEALAVRPAP
jgi:hypothetical protein